MDKRYEVFCLADRYFYETPDRLSEGPSEAGTEASAGTSGAFPTALRPVPEGWRADRSGDWLQLSPVRGELRAQGWKVHASATLRNADTVAAAVWDYCVPRNIPFKFVPARTLLYLRNAKYAGRDTSGKFATVYPENEEQLRTLLTELGGTLAGEPGPYILTDLRWGEGPLYVRYGGFARRFCLSPQGTLVPAIEDADGRLVPDRRDPVFHVPDWVTLPGFLRPHLEARQGSSLGGLPYRVHSALHFSNGGGVYGGTDVRTGEEVVLKEARPHAGLAADGADAVARLEREKAALDRLEGLSVAPGVRDWFTLDGHRFLVMDHLPGQTLNSFFARRHPLLTETPDPADVAEYTRWALRIHRMVEEAVEAVHSRGLVFNDLHMFNIMVAPDEQSVSLLDFEAAAPAEDDPRQIVAHPGFIAPADRVGYEIDHYALACLRIALFVPMTMLLAVDRAKAAHLAEVAAEQFPELPPRFLRDAVATIEGRWGGRLRSADAAAHTPPPPSAAVRPSAQPHGRDAMAKAVLASATPEREDRLFPGDIAQFADGGGLGLAHGAAGVLYALAEIGAPSCPEGEEWLLRHSGAPPPGTPLGLYDGLTGVAHVLDRLGHSEEALKLADRVLDEKWQRLGPTLNGGLAGIGLALDRLGTTTGESVLHDHAATAARLLAESLESGAAEAGKAGDGGRGGQDPWRGRAGLLHGATGAALLFLRLHERTGDAGLLDLAALALRRDLARCVADRAGTLQVDEGNRIMPYLGGGSAGIGMVLDDLLEHRPGAEEFERARAAVLPAARMRYYAQPGLFQGRAGMLLYLSRTTAPGADTSGIDAQLGAMAWYGMNYRGGLAFPGNQMMRLSMDLATGTAGCLLATSAAAAALRGEPPTGLPFLPPLPRGGPKTGPETGRTDAPPSP